MALDIKVFRRALLPSIKQLGGLAYGTALSQLKGKKNKIIQEFTYHAVSQEILQGPEYEGSKFLSVGNLYSFIGFNYGDEPVERVINQLEYAFDVDKNYTLEDADNGYLFIFKAIAPSYDKIADNPANSLPWAKGRSWVREIEEGFSGLTHYVFGNRFPTSRSQWGLQYPGPISGRGELGPIPYLRPILDGFSSKFI